MHIFRMLIMGPHSPTPHHTHPVVWYYYTPPTPTPTPTATATATVLWLPLVRTTISGTHSFTTSIPSEGAHLTHLSHPATSQLTLTNFFSLDQGTSCTELRLEAVGASLSGTSSNLTLGTSSTWKMTDQKRKKSTTMDTGNGRLWLHSSLGSCFFTTRDLW